MLGRRMERRESKGLSTGFGGEWIKGNTQWGVAMGGGRAHRHSQEWDNSVVMERMVVP